MKPRRWSRRCFRMARGAGRGVHPEGEEALKGSAHSATYPVIDGRALKVSGCVREQQHDKENHNC